MASMEFRKFRDSDTSAWEAKVSHSNNGTLFHERKFLSYHPAERFLDHSYLIYKKKRLLALFPAARVMDPQNSPWLVSHPGSSYGGFVYPADLRFRDAYDLVISLIQRATKDGMQGIRMTLPPAIYQHRVSNYLDFALLKHGFEYERREISSMLSIEDDPKVNLARFRPSHRTAVRRALKQGVEVIQSEDYAQFYTILRENLKIRHNVAPTHSLEELQRLKRLYPDRIRLFGAFHSGHMIAGVVTFAANTDVLLAFYISHVEAFQELRAVNLLFYEIIRWCQQESYRYLDFGIFTVNMDPNFGLGRFKENFGASGVFRDTFVRRLD